MIKFLINNFFIFLKIILLKNINLKLFMLFKINLYYLKFRIIILKFKIIILIKINLYYLKFKIIS
jgi:hypothetical protein